MTKITTLKRPLPVIPFIRSVFENFIYLFYPILCSGCYRMMYGEEKGLCSTCRMQLPIITTAEEQELLRQKFSGRVQVDYVYSYAYFTKKSRMQRIIHQLKYRHKPELGYRLGLWHGQELVSASAQPLWADLLIPVPIHPIRRRQRGYNQSELIARGLSEAMQLNYRDDVMERTKFVASQTRKNRFERWRNVSTAFRVKDLLAVKGKHVALVDDVLTTGATLEACVVALREAGCQTVGILTIAATR